jgi:hypothetical protein
VPEKRIAELTPTFVVLCVSVWRTNDVVPLVMR